MQHLCNTYDAPAAHATADGFCPDFLPSRCFAFGPSGGSRLSQLWSGMWGIAESRNFAGFFHPFPSGIF
jgi:hypothetical protein